MIPPLNLASDPSVKIIMREATVSDCMDFADADPAHEEAVTTLFLNRIQDKAAFRDSKLWTADDRRLALFWYWIHTERDTLVPISYECGCGETHKTALDYKLLAENYHPIKGRPERDIEFNGKKITVRPLSGEAMEALELMRLAMDEAPDSKTRHRAMAELSLEEFLCLISCPDTDMKKFVLGLGMTAFGELAEQVGETIADMRHGLESEYENGRVYLITPPVDCPNKGKEVTTRLRVRFRNNDYIPRI